MAELPGGVAESFCQTAELLCQVVDLLRQLAEWYYQMAELLCQAAETFHQAVKLPDQLAVAFSQMTGLGVLPDLFQRIGDGGLDLARAVAAQLPVHIFQPADEVEQVFARIRSAGGIAKVRAAAE